MPQQRHLQSTPIATHCTPSIYAMLTNTCSNKPCNHSGLQCQAPATEKRKHTESGANKSNKKLKSTANETMEDVDDNVKATRKGKKAVKGKEKGTKCAHKTAANCAQDDAAADAAGPPGHLTRAECILEESGVSIAPPMHAHSTNATHVPPPPEPIVGWQCHLDAARAQSSKNKQTTHDGSRSDDSHNNNNNNKDNTNKDEDNANNNNNKANNDKGGNGISSICNDEDATNMVDKPHHTTNALAANTPTPNTLKMGMRTTNNTPNTLEMGMCTTSVNLVVYI